jgi:hypothetical protein
MFKLTATLYGQVFLVTHVYIMTTNEKSGGGGRCVAISTDKGTFTHPFTGTDENRDPFAQIIIK